LINLTTDYLHNADDSALRFLSSTSAVTAEPRGLDYAEVSADGVPAMWLVRGVRGPGGGDRELDGELLVAQPVGGARRA
jgi:hypothetical protein